MDKEKFKIEAKKSIDSIFADIDALEAKKNQVKKEMKKEFEEKLTSLKFKKDEIQMKYNLLMETTNYKWEETKNAFSSASDSFKEGFAKITSLLH